MQAGQRCTENYINTKNKNEMKEKVIQTRFNEIRVSTNDVKLMRNQYLSEPIVRTWFDDYTDMDTGELIKIERSEIIAERGQIVTPDLISQILFYLQSGDINEVHVSNQRREGYVSKNSHVFPWYAVVKVGDKKKRIILQATNINSAIECIKDYCELNLRQAFDVIQIKEFVSAIILKDNLKSIENKSDDNPDDDLDLESQTDNRLHQIEVKIVTTMYESTSLFLVETKDTEKAMILIDAYVRQRFSDDSSTNIEHIKIETAKIVPCDVLIDYEFSQVYF